MSGTDDRRDELSPLGLPCHVPGHGEPVMDRVRRARGGRGEIDAPPSKFEAAALAARGRTCIACRTAVRADKGHTVGHGGRLVGAGDERRVAREGALVCDGCWEPDPLAASMRLAPEHFYTAAAEAWASVQGDQIDALDDQLRAAVGAVLDLVDEPEAPRVVDVDSLAIEADLAAARVDLSKAYHERDTARAERDQIAQDFDDLKRRHEVIEPPTARAAGKNRIAYVCGSCRNGSHLGCYWTRTDPHACACGCWPISTRTPEMEALVRAEYAKVKEAATDG